MAQKLTVKFSQPIMRKKNDMYEKFLYPETRHVVLNMEVFIKVSFFFGKMKAKPVGKEREREDVKRFLNG